MKRLKKFIEGTRNGQPILKPLFAFNMNAEGDCGSVSFESTDNIEIITQDIEPLEITENDFLSKDIKTCARIHQRKMTLIFHEKSSRYLLVDSSLFEDSVE